MVWKKQITIYGSMEAMSKFNEAEFAAKFQSAWGPTPLDVRKNTHADHIAVSMIFHDEDSTMAPLDKEMLVKLTSEYLDEEVQIHIQPGGAGSL